MLLKATTERSSILAAPWASARVAMVAFVMCATPWLAPKLAIAGPADTDVEPPARSSQSAPSTRSSRAEAATPGGVVSSGGTMDLLIDLQGKSVGLEFKDKAKTAVERSGALGGTGSAEPVPKAASGGLFGSGAAAMVQKKPEAGEEFNPTATRTVAVGAAQPGSDDAIEQAKRNMQIQGSGDEGPPGAAQVLLAWVRENRVIVIMLGLVLLGLVGVASMGGGGRR